MNSKPIQLRTTPNTTGMTRRDVLRAGGAVLLGGGITAGYRGWTRHERGARGAVFIGRAESYDADLVSMIEDGLRAVDLDREKVRGMRVLLKPNLVETSRGEPHINTHPSVILAAAEVFRRLDAREVMVAEGQGHSRDTELVLDESGMSRAIHEGSLPFIDLNHTDFTAVKNRGGWSPLKELFLPKALLGADLIVSVPKLKTHHWAGVTCSMKNLFGVMPGIVYGWPKNVLHYAGIPQSILDINATVRPHLAIVDGVIGMEGDGPIMGTPKPAHCIIVGRNFPAVDATAVRVMGLNPYGVTYLTHASGRLGPIHEWNIEQRGETISSVQTRFDVLHAPHLANLVAG